MLFSKIIGKSNRLFLNSAKLSLLTAVGQLIAVILSPLLTRLYSPSDYGFLGIFTSILAVALTVSAFRYEYSITKSTNEHERGSLVVISLVILLAISTLLFLGAFVSLDSLNGIFKFSADSKILLFLPVTLLCAGIFQIGTFVAIKQGEIGYLGMVRLIQTASMVIFQIYFAFTYLSTLGLILGQALGYLLGGLLFFKMIRNTFSKSITMNNFFISLRKFRSFAIFSSISVLLASLANQLPMIFLWLIFNVQAAGYFALTQRVMVLPLRILGSAISQAYLSELVAEERNILRINLLFRRAMLQQVVVAIPTALTLFFIVPKLIGLVFGNTWYEAGIFIKILAIPVSIELIAVVIGLETVNILGDSRLLPFREFLRIAIVGLSFAISIFLKLNIYNALLAYAISHSASMIMYVLMANKVIMDLNTHTRAVNDHNE